MKQNIMCVYDSKAEIYNQPMFFKAKGEAIRAFSDEVNKSGSPMNQHPEDYTLFHIGIYNVETGLIEPLKAHQSMGTALDYQKEDVKFPNHQLKVGGTD